MGTGANKITSTATYSNDGNRLLSATGSLSSTLGTHNPLRYRGYVYDTETKLYYLQSRYYNPEVGRFINVDAFASTGQGLLSNNMFAYCGNCPTSGYDPTGTWDWGGVIVGLGILAATAITVATFGIGSPLGAVVAAAAITTGVVTTYAAATDSTMVIDVSYSKQVFSNYYIKFGVSCVIDFEQDNANCFFHLGAGRGYSNGLSYSVGLVDNYSQPEDYSKHFVDANAGYMVGFDHCRNPLSSLETSTNATSLTFSSGISYGIGYDYYFSPQEVATW